MILNPKVLVGLSEDDAKSIIEGSSLLWRVSKRNGKAIITTRDVREDRITMEIKDEVVTAAQIA